MAFNKSTFGGIGKVTNRVKTPSPSSKSNTRPADVKENSSAIESPSRQLNQSTDSVNLSSSENSYSGFEGDHFGSAKGSSPLRREVRMSCLLGKISSFMTDKDLNKLKQYLVGNKSSTGEANEGKAKADNNAFIKHLEVELSRIEKRLKKSFSIEKSVNENYPEGVLTLEKIFEEVKSSEGGIDSIIPFYGGEKDSDGVTSVGREISLEGFSPEENTVLTSRCILTLKAPYLPLLERLNETYYHGLKLIYRYSALSKLLVLMEDVESGNGFYKIADESLDEVLSDLATYNNVVEGKREF